MLCIKLSLKWLLVAVSISGAVGQILKPCKIGDDACVSESVKAAYPQLMEGNPSLGIDSSDPLFIPHTHGDLSYLKFTLTNTTFKGYKNCAVSNVKLDLNNLYLHLELDCPNVYMEGLYVISGRLIILPVEGDGDYYIDAKRYKIGVDAELKKTQEKDGKEHILIKNFKLSLVPAEPVHYNFNNLFNGQKDLGDTVLKFANENWSEVASLVQEPTFKAQIKIIISHVNKYLKTIPLEEMIIN